MKIVTIIGARPQFIKAAPVSQALKKHKGVQEILLHTGQHFDANMSDIFFREMKIPKPKYHLGINSLEHGAMTGRMMEGIEKILLKEKPDWVLVYGDTNSTLAGALAAKKLHIRLAHVEAGLRSFNMKMPEEINRILTDRISNLLFCPTQTAVSNLNKEGFNSFKNRIVLSGDVMLDALLQHSKSGKDSIILSKNFYRKIILCTLHREENTNDISVLKRIIAALNEIHRSAYVFMPAHPRTAQLIRRHRIPVKFFLLPPLSYHDMMYMVDSCKMVITDSGGLQKEACFFRKFCITVREQTEWTELVEAGVNIITGSNKKKILSAFKKFSIRKFPRMKNPYGDGHAADRIAKALINY